MRVQYHQVSPSMTKQYTRLLASRGSPPEAVDGPVAPAPEFALAPPPPVVVVVVVPPPPNKFKTIPSQSPSNNVVLGSNSSPTSRTEMR